MEIKTLRQYTNCQITSVWTSWEPISWNRAPLQSVNFANTSRVVRYERFNRHSELNCIPTSIYLKSSSCARPRTRKSQILKSGTSSSMSWIFVVFALIPFHNLMITAEQCLPGTFHKETSSPGGNAYAECQAWNEDTCCTANFTMELNQNRVKNLYNFHWGHCKNLSQVSNQI